MKWTTVAVVFCHLLSVSLCQSLGSCDYQKYPINGCEDEMGSDCDTTTSQCRCKQDNWLVVDKRFCFPIKCPIGQYYDHNFGRCEAQRVASLNSELNYCRHDFHCKGDHIRCQHMNEWNYRCVCDNGFVFDSSTQECQQIRGLNGFCRRDDDCDLNHTRELFCVNQSCQCLQDFTYNLDIDGCESNERIKARDNQTRKMMFLFIGLGLFFGTALSLKFGSNSSAAAQQALFKRVIESRKRQLDEQQQQNRQQLQMANDDETDSTCVDIETNATSDDKPINKHAIA